MIKPPKILIFSCLVITVLTVILYIALGKDSISTGLAAGVSLALIAALEFLIAMPKKALPGKAIVTYYVQHVIIRFVLITALFVVALLALRINPIGLIGGLGMTLGLISLIAVVKLKSMLRNGGA